MFTELLYLVKILKSAYFKHSLDYQAVLDIKNFLKFISGFNSHDWNKSGRELPLTNDRGRIFEEKVYYWIEVTPCGGE